MPEIIRTRPTVSNSRLSSSVMSKDDVCVETSKGGKTTERTYDEQKQDNLRTALLKRFPDHEVLPPRYDWDGFGFDTRQVHAGEIDEPAHGARIAPIYLSAAYRFDSFAQAEARYRLGVCAWKLSQLDDAQKLMTAALLTIALATAACNTVRGAAADVNSVANCTENAIEGKTC